MDKLVGLVDMNILIPTQAVFCETEGNEGITAIVCIDTSHASIHLWNSPTSILRFDLYSCKDFDEQRVLEHLKLLGVSEVEYQIIDRN
jgi:S-adenosylmethionine/arginine decarboxylase-like enzyme